MVDEHSRHVVNLYIVITLFCLAPALAAFTEDTSISLTGLQYSSQAWTDYNLDGNMDVIMCGQSGPSASTRNTTLYTFSVNSSGSATAAEVTHNFMNATACSVNWGDINGDHYDDLILAGNTTEGEVLLIYENLKNESFNNTQNLTGIVFGNTVLGDIDNDNDLDLISIGCTSLTSTCTNKNSSIYINTAGTLTYDQTWSTNLEDVWRGSIALGDYDNDGDLDLLLSGTTGDDETTSITHIYNNTGSTFTLDINNNLTGVYWGSAAWGDYDNDTDLDMFIAGLNITSDRSTIVYENDQELYSTNTRPSAPTITLTDTGTKLHINWSGGTDTENSSGLYYNIRIGDTVNPNKFVSGLYARSSNPTQGYFGNMQQKTSYNLTHYNRCMVVQVQTIDQGMFASDWSTTTRLQFSQEEDDDYDNDCDGTIDEGFGSISGGGSGGGGGSASGGTGLTEDEDQGSEIIEGEGNGNGQGGGGGSEDTTPPETAEITKPVAVESPASYETPIIESVVNQILTNSIQLTRTFSINRGKTLVTDKIKNNYPVDQTINLETTIPKEIAENTDEITEITPFEVIEYDPVIGFSPTLSSFEEQTIQYTFSKELTEEEISQILSQITGDKNAQEEIKQLIENTEESTNITIKYEINPETNQTKITLDIDIDNEAALYNVSVFQEIPKCLVEIINDQMIEAENKNFEIINIDPLIVWHFDNILDAKQIQYTINAIADENCTNQLQALAVAKDIILVKKAGDINYFNLGIALSIIPLLALIMIIFGLITRHIEHEDEEMAKLTKIIKTYYKNGFKKYDIKEKLLKLGHPLKRIDECLHLHTQSKIHYWLHRLEIGFEEFILFTLITLNILDFTETLPGDIDYLKKIISWVLLAYLLYHVSITEVLLGTRKRLLDILLILTFFSLTFKNIISYAKVAWQEVNLVLDLYSYLITNNIIFERYVFIAAIVILLITSLYIAIFVEIKAPSFLTALHVKEGKLKDLTRLPFRFIMIHITLLGFFTLVFNLMMEWLAIAVDALIIVITLIAMLIIIFKHHKKFKIGAFMEETSSFAEHFYEKFVSLFHYKKTIYLGISGMLILHAVTEVGNFVIPYFIGVHDAIYFGNFNTGHMPLFSFTQESLFTLQTVSLDLITKTQVAFIYVMNLIALVFLLLLPALVWVNFFNHRALPILETLKFRVSKNHIFNALLFGVFTSSVFLFLTKPVFKLQSLLGGESLAGVDILTQEITFTFMGQFIVIALGLGILAFVISFFFEKIMNWIMLPASYLFFAYYVSLFGVSIYNYNLTQFSLLIQSNIFIAIYTLIFGILSLSLLYAFGFLINSYLYAPPTIKHLMHITPLLKKIFEKHSHHHIHHHDSHKDHMHDSKEQALKAYIQKSLDSGHELFYAVEHLVEHGWPKDLIEEAIEDTITDNKYKTEVKHIKHYHHNQKKIHELADWIKNTYENHTLKDILDTALKKTWTEDDIILAFKLLKDKIRIHPEDKEVMKYMKIIE